MMADQALAPVRAALLARAGHDAERVRERAAAEAGAVLAAAAQEAAQIRERARERGAADAAAALAAERARAGRRAHAMILAATREAYEELRAAARAATAALQADPGYPLVRQHMADTARRLLGPDAELTDGAGGGIFAVAVGRRLDFSLTSLADRAVDAVLAAEIGDEP